MSDRPDPYDLFERNQRLVYWCLRRWPSMLRHYSSYEDAVQEGMIGLWTASCKWDPDHPTVDGRQIKFSPLAIRHIRNRVNDRNRRTDRERRDGVGAPLSLEAPLHARADGSDLTLGDSVEAPPHFSGFDAVEARMVIGPLLQYLNPQALQVISRLYGIGDGSTERHAPSDWRVRTLGEVGDELGLTRERIRQIHDRGITAMRNRTPMPVGTGNYERPARPGVPPKGKRTNGT